MKPWRPEGSGMIKYLITVERPNLSRVNSVSGKTVLQKWGADIENKLVVTCEEREVGEGQYRVGE